MNSPADVEAWRGRNLSGSQEEVLGTLRAAPQPMSPLMVAAALGRPDSSGGVGNILGALFRRGLIQRAMGERTAMYWVNGEPT